MEKMNLPDSQLSFVYSKLVIQRHWRSTFLFDHTPKITMPVKRDLTPHTGHRVPFPAEFLNRLRYLPPSDTKAVIPNPEQNAHHRVEFAIDQESTAHQFQARVDDEQEDEIPIHLEYISFPPAPSNSPFSTASTPEPSSTAFSPPLPDLNLDPEEFNLFNNHLRRAPSQEPTAIAALRDFFLRRPSWPVISPPAPATGPHTFPIIFQVHFSVERLLSPPQIHAVPFHHIAHILPHTSYPSLISAIIFEFNTSDPELSRFCPQPQIQLLEEHVEKLRIEWPKIHRHRSLFGTSLHLGNGVNIWEVKNGNEDDVDELVRLLEKARGRVVLHVYVCSSSFSFQRLENGGMGMKLIDI
jgi:hypothetical protein